MKISALILGFFVLFTPAFTAAEDITCANQGYTVVFVNGIFGDKIKAQFDAGKLWYQLGKEYNSEPLTVRLGYNPTHLAGAGDLAQVATQLFMTPVSSFDLKTILMQIHPEVTTRKVLFVGHSQGAFYANDLYTYVVGHGQPTESTAVYNIGSPASYTAGGWKYLNSSGDTLLAFLRAAGFMVLPNNVDLSPSGADNHWDGHAIVEDYLEVGGSRVQNDIASELAQLTANNTPSTDGCFTAPSKTLSYQTVSVAFAVADPTAVVLKEGTVAVAKTGAIAVNFLGKVAVGTMQFFADTISVTTNPLPEKERDEKTLQITNKLYGSSLDKLTPQDKKELLGASVVLAVEPKPKEKTIDKPLGIVLGTSSEIVIATTPVATSTPATPFINNITGPIVGMGAGGGGGSTPVVTPEVVLVDTPIVPEEPTATTTETTATTTQDSTPEEPVVTPPASVMFESFDAFNDKGWVTIPNFLNSYALFTKVEAGDPDCKIGACASSGGYPGGLGTTGQYGLMYVKNIFSKTAGAFTLWARVRKVFTAYPEVAICASESPQCSNDNVSYNFSDFAPKDDQWHHYYFGWRNGAELKEFCMLMDQTDSSMCSWSNQWSIPNSTVYDGIFLMGRTTRPDQGDNVWFDDIEFSNDPPPVN
jgi:hypothetical protein